MLRLITLSLSGIRGSGPRMTRIGTDKMGELFMLVDVSVDKFRSNLGRYVDQVVDTHQPLRVMGCNSADFIVVSIEEWEATQKRLAILQNNDLSKAEDNRGDYGR